MKNARDVVITGMGVISPVGTSITGLLEYLETCRSGIRQWESHYLTRKFPAATIPQSFEADFKRIELPYLDRCAQIAILAARQAITDAGLDTFEHEGPRAGLYFGSARAGTASEERWFEELLLEHRQTAKPFAVFSIMHNAPAAHISIRHQILGPVMTHSSACTSSGCAIGDGYRQIRDGYVDVAIAGGAEAPITASVLGAWDGTRAIATIDPEDVGLSCRPFSNKRTGLVMGEGAAFIVMESRERAERRGARIHGRLAGYGVASDGYHIGSPKMTGQAEAMSLALADAGMAPDEIGYYNAHATATKGGDAIEAQAMRLAFGAAADRIPVSSTKSIHGHLLGAASVLELIISTLSIQHQMIPATLGLEDIDPECSLHHVPNTPLRGYPIRSAMSFSSGLGGTNTALIVAKDL
ncbi:MAG: beta-ketoacyl-[acyl-carrier-protein] synthase family protein [Proteobacteria bacterium]|nr:beta-ketoacyl-[acyl-carrier-protein] synthase family protein [Pseudomonadota bacterium]HQR03539.1 beta-ketoacyl-[acyl-carrier-protein] synthase family protein [Rhodocyclaceae bacterium]